jgi:hypothetical protein
VYAAVNAPGPGYGNLSHLFKVDFANGISGFHDKDITLTDRASGVKYRVNRHGKVEKFNIRANDPAPEQLERIEREEGRQ